MGDGSIDLHGFQGFFPLLFWGLVLHGAHIVQPVGDLDEDDADVLAHRHEHLAKTDKSQNIKILKSSLKITKHTENGFVQEITAKDNKWTGEEWKKIFALNSTNFYLENYNGKLRMVTVGKGHDMGMSLYGANALAEKQITAATILSYYYPGTKVVTPDLPQAK